jgi:hypothetical protein
MRAYCQRDDDGHLWAKHSKAHLGASCTQDASSTRGTPLYNQKSSLRFFVPVEVEAVADAAGAVSAGNF